MSKDSATADSIIADPSLAPEGHRKIEWVAQHSPVLERLSEEELADGALRGRRIAMSIHLKAETAHLALLLSRAGAEVTVAGSNPLSTQDDVCAALAERGVRVFARNDPPEEELEDYLMRTIDTAPEIILDHGAELTGRTIFHRPELLENVAGVCEGTSTGILKLRAMEVEEMLAFPVLGGNDVRMKYLFDNRYGTGESVIVSLLTTTNLTLRGKKVVVMGFGWVGRGIAAHARDFGAQVIVCEPDPVKLLEAYAEGYEIMGSLDAAEVGDLFITGTGNFKVLNPKHFERMKSGAILANAGHYDLEVDVTGLQTASRSSREVRRHITEYELSDGRILHLLGRGRPVNLACGDGNSTEIMDLTFAVQALVAHRLASEPRGEPESLPSGLHSVPEEIDYLVARTKLWTLGVEPEELTEEQITYQSSWQ